MVDFQGFQCVAAEGCFNVHITKRVANTVGYNTKLRFILDQNDSYALEIIKNTLKTGFISKRSAARQQTHSYRYISNSLIGCPPPGTARQSYYNFLF
jgi:hypothetical protein